MSNATLERIIDLIQVTRSLALSLTVIALPYYQTNNPMFAGITRRTLDEVLEDYQQNG